MSLAHQIYYYRKDIQGNITALLNSKGEILAEYAYDAWGNHKVLNASGEEITDTSHIGHLNPFRYRGYYYDTETGLYYLQSRYYDPEAGRFISQDSIELANPYEQDGLNLYAYCINNPVMYVDPYGKSFFEFLSKVLRFIGGGALAGVSAIGTVLSLPLSMIPGLNIVNEFYLTMTFYGGAVAVSAFNDEVADDLRLINWNPFNSDANKVIQSSYISFYKGATVFRHDFNGSMGLAGMIFLHRGADADYVRHEYGHIVQERVLGFLLYLFIVAIPSYIMKDSKNASKFYTEIWADKWGNVSPAAWWLLP